MSECEILAFNKASHSVNDSYLLSQHYISVVTNRSGDGTKMSDAFVTIRDLQKKLF